MSFEMPSFNSNEQIEDPDIARKAAEVEDPYHKKTLGFIPASEEKIAKGVKAAEDAVAPDLADFAESKRRQEMQAQGENSRAEQERIKEELKQRLEYLQKETEFQLERYRVVSNSDKGTTETRWDNNHSIEYNAVKSDRTRENLDQISRELDKLRAEKDTIETKLNSFETKETRRF